MRKSVVGRGIALALGALALVTSQTGASEREEFPRIASIELRESGAYPAVVVGFGGRDDTTVDLAMIYKLDHDGETVVVDEFLLGCEYFPGECTDPPSRVFSEAALFSRWALQVMNDEPEDVFYDHRTAPGMETWLVRRQLVSGALALRRPVLPGLWVYAVEFGEESGLWAVRLEGDSPDGGATIFWNSAARRWVRDAPCVECNMRWETLIAYTITRLNGSPAEEPDPGHPQMPHYSSFVRELRVFQSSVLYSVYTPLIGR